MRPTKVSIVHVPLFGECILESLRCRAPELQLELLQHHAVIPTQVRGSCPDVLLVAWDLPDGGTARWTREVARDFGEVKILIFGTPDNQQSILACLEAGARDYLTADSTLAQLEHKIARVSRGQTDWPAELVFTMSARLADLARASALGRGVLTERELEVLRLIDAGLSNKEIAARLKRSLHTVKNHVHHILEKLEVHSRHQAVRWLHKQSV